MPDLKPRMRVQFHTLGCRLNEAETERWAAQFQRHGFGIAAPHEVADLLVVNTCAVTGEAVRKSRSLLRRSQRRCPDAKLVITGCLAALETESLVAALPPAAVLVPNRDKDRLVEIVLDRLALTALPDRTAADPGTPLFGRGRQRAFVKVQDGCRHRCTFCIVSRARGAERSRPIAEVCDAVAQLAAAGVREVVLTGVHLGGYGRGLGCDLADLVETLLAATRVERIRLGALEPWDIPVRLWGLFADPRLMPHLHLPVQSGSDRLLRRMGRRSSATSFARLAETARHAAPDINLTTDILVGFPGETEADWSETMDFVSAIGFGDLHIFAYSPRPGTPAAAWPDAVPRATQRARCRALRELAERQRDATMRRFVGRAVPVLIEASGPQAANGDWFGYTPSYLPVRLPSGGVVPPPGQILPVALTDLHPDGGALSGQVLDEPHTTSAASSTAGRREGTADGV